MSKREQAAKIIHDQWKKRNTWAKGTDLYKEYAVLPPHEKDKDRAHVDIVLHCCKEGITSKIALKKLIPSIFHQQWLDTYKKNNDGPRIKQFKNSKGKVICEGNIAVEYNKLPCEQAKTENIAAAVAAVNAVFEVYGFNTSITNLRELARKKRIQDSSTMTKRDLIKALA